MTRTLSPPTTTYRAERAAEGHDRFAYGLCVLLLILLPIERTLIPFGLKLADLPLVALTIYGLIRAWYTRRRLVFPLLLPIWFILFVSLLATLLGLLDFASVVAVIQEMYLFAWFLSLTNVLLNFPLSDLDRLLKVWSVVACLECVTTVMGMLRIGPSQFYTKPRSEPTLIREPEVESTFARAVGTFANANAAAVYISVSFFAVLATSWPLLVRAGIAAWIYLGIFGTGSNGALLTTVGGLMALILVNSILGHRHEVKLWAGLMNLGVGALALAFFALSLYPSLLSGLGFDMRGGLFFQTLGRFSHSLEDRVEIFAWALDIYKDYPWGVGPNAFASLAGSLHNDYAAFLFERGPLGLIGWVWLVGSTLVRPLRTAVRLLNARHRWQVLCLWAGFLACAVNAFSHELSHMRQMWVLITFLTALCYAYLARQDQNLPDHAREGQP